MSMALELAVKRLENRVAALELAAQAPYEAAMREMPVLPVPIHRPPYSVHRGLHKFIVKDASGQPVEEFPTKAAAEEYAEALPQS